MNSVVEAMEFLLLTQILRAGVLSLESAYFTAIENCDDHRLSGYDLHSGTALSTVQCASQCGATAGCTGFNIQQTQDLHFTCELKALPAPITTCADASVQSEPGAHVYVIGMLTTLSFFH